MSQQQLDSPTEREKFRDLMIRLDLYMVMADWDRVEADFAAVDIETETDFQLIGRLRFTFPAAAKIKAWIPFRDAVYAKLLRQGKPVDHMMRGLL